MARIGWLAKKNGDGTNGFQKVEIIDEGPDYRQIAIKGGEQNGQTLVIPGKGIPFQGFHPALYEQAEEPKVWWFKGRSLLKVDINSFKDPKAAKALIPEEEPYDFPPHTLEIIDGIIAGDHELLFGHKGVGKTSIIMQIAARIGQPMVRINITGHTTLSDLVGSCGVSKEGTYFNYGPVMIAMMHGYWCLADEFDFGEPRVLSMFHSILEKRPSYCLKENNGEIIVAEKGFRFFATGNSIGGDSDGQYAGTEQMNTALLDRFSGHGRIIKVQAMNAKQERKVLQARMPNLPNRLVKRATEFAAEVRVKTLPTFSTRELLNWCQKMVEYRDAIQAARITFMPVIREDAVRTAVEQFIADKVGRRIILGRTVLPTAVEGTPTPNMVAGAPVTVKVPKVKKAENAVGRTAADVNDPAELEKIYKLAKKYGGPYSFEQIEEDASLNLKKANGMTAYRICEKYLGLKAKAEGKPMPEKDEEKER